MNLLKPKAIVKKIRIVSYKEGLSIESAMAIISKVKIFEIIYIPKESIWWALKAKRASARHG